MAKRYHQSKKSRRDEHMGMESYERGPVKKRGMREKKASMISEDMSARALLPQGVMDKPWPMEPRTDMGRRNDLFRGVQDQLEEDARDFKREMKASKY